jgi:flavin-dependent dehydrogenase
VVILGGAFSGASLGLLLRRERPQARILILEKSEAFDRKVGESTSEVAGCFLTRVLNLGNHLSSQQFQKHGLRLWFTRPGNDCPGRCTEIGPSLQARLPTYQLDRERLDTHILAEAAGAGCEVLRGAAVKSFSLGGTGNNQVSYKHAGTLQTVRATYLVDASGKAALVARQRGTLQPLAGHATGSMWVRYRNVRCLDSHEGRKKLRPIRAQRGTATNHLMGYGWWCWIIPLANGEYSAGVTWDERLFSPPKDGSIGERLKQHLCSHPVGKLMFEDAEAVENDARAYKGLAYFSSEVAGDGWAAVGDAGGFMDPLYSQGLDFCGHSVYSVKSILLRGLAGEETTADLARYNGQFQQSYHRWYESLYKDKYYYLGDAELMNAAFLMDLGTYFLGPVRLVYEDTDGEFSKMPYDGAIGGGFARFMSFYNRRLVVLAKKRRAAGTYGAANLEHDLLLRESFQAKPLAIGLLLRGIRRWLGLEARHLFVPLPHDEAQEEVTGAVPPRNAEAC